MELYARLSHTSIIAFLDLKSAFDVANGEVILAQLVEFGVQENLLRWIRGYLRNRTSRMLFKVVRTRNLSLVLHRARY